jgi:hypothetical protein
MLRERHVVTAHGCAMLHHDGFLKAARTRSEPCHRTCS